MSDPKSLRELEPFDCRYPVGSPKQPAEQFCGATVQFGSPYCPKHHALCYQPYTGREAV